MLKESKNLQNELIEFIDSQKSVIISSFDDFCLSSYAPFIRLKDSIFVIISSIARHYQAINKNKELVSVMFIEDESMVKSIFARFRASFSVEVGLKDELRDEIFSKFEEKFKDEVALKMIKDLKDFHIIEFKLKNGRFVKGFGRAYDLDGLNVTNSVKG
ncbi:pyridoxamine 5'-phosphate oxidase [Campylobacter corcagiensis]|uniref:Pyridoxamine 5'-phosphate oxidase n=1 Tax=Campylobacter corcagiensis TaxID=1448857 RepID=A0A7M1LGJ4_9BACT|nr:pyridoxamine 5'-phosphate oxidase [Campylobacter corcagiensis]QKF64117.1 heme oxygenase, HugZ family [Campylobacter corcagiensis]QOQ87688.1 pyridoxamine 5'-phosphate oxidase [Campylobacter corcagiensis]